MKNVLALSCLLLAVTIVQGDILDTYLEAAKEPLLTCAKEDGYSGENLREIHEQQSITGVDAATCVRSCMLKRMNILKDMKIDQDQMMKDVKDANADQPEKFPILQKAVSECAEKAESLTDECKLAYLFVECFLAKI